MKVNDASRIVINDSRVMLQIVMAFTNDSTGVINGTGTGHRLKVVDHRNFRLLSNYKNYFRVLNTFE